MTDVQGNRAKALVVEDEALIAMMIEEMLTDLDCGISGIAGSVAEALQMAEHHEIDFAILDLNVAGGQTYPVADVLGQRGIPVIFASGGHQAMADYPDALQLPKPFSFHDLSKAVDGVLSRTQSPRPA